MCKCVYVYALPLVCFVFLLIKCAFPREIKEIALIFVPFFSFPPPLISCLALFQKRKDKEWRRLVFEIDPRFIPPIFLLFWEEDDSFFPLLTLSQRKYVQQWIASVFEIWLLPVFEQPFFFPSYLHTQHPNFFSMRMWVWNTRNSYTQKKKTPSGFFPRASLIWH